MRKSVLLALSTFGCLALAATAASAEKRLRIAIVPVNLNNVIFMDALENADRAGRELGVDVLVSGSPNADAGEQIRTMERLIERKFDGILLFPVDSAALRDVVNRAVDNGIVVGVLNSDIPDSRRAFYYGTNNYELGKRCGEKMREIMGGKGTIAIQIGIAGMAAMDERVQGFRDAIAGSDMVEVALQENNDNSDLSSKLINDYLAENPDLDGYFITGGWPFFGPPENMPELFKFRQRGGKLGIIDNFYPMFRYMDRPDPLVDFMIGQDFADMGYSGVKMIVDILRGGKVEREISYSPLEYCDHDNLREVLAGKKP
ncbi:MAG: substrate-binding domain-containing protein [Planctomycetota bacterium]|nr:substrate-binding domain-containing protein [Planctomycetota bacterium]